MRQSQEDLMWQEAAARQEKQEAKYREEIVALRQRAEAAEAVLASIPMAPLLRIVEALLMRGRPLQFDMDAAERWLNAQSRA